MHFFYVIHPLDHFVKFIRNVLSSDEQNDLSGCHLALTVQSVCLTLNRYGHTYFGKTSKVHKHYSCIDKSDSFYNASYSSMILSHQYSYYYFFVRIGRKKSFDLTPRPNRFLKQMGNFCRHLLPTCAILYPWVRSFANVFQIIVYLTTIYSPMVASNFSLLLLSSLTLSTKVI